jgi:hypothetical protein
VAEFRRFVKATDHVTWAEQSPDPDEDPGADPELLVPGTLVFQPTAGPVDLNDPRHWWVQGLLLGDEFAPRGRLMANTWQGEFPWQNLRLDGYERTSPVERFPQNGYGLVDMALLVSGGYMDGALKSRRPGR